MSNARDVPLWLSAPLGIAFMILAAPALVPWRVGRSHATIAEIVIGAPAIALWLIALDALGISHVIPLVVAAIAFGAGLVWPSAPAEDYP